MAASTRTAEPVGTSGPAIAAYLAAATFALHFATAGLYGFFIDELYFLACGEHLAWGYVDFPPLTAFQAWLTRALFGDSPYSIRLFPSLASAGLVLLTAAIARALGGGRFAQGLAALAILVCPLYLAFGSYLSMNSIEPLVWMGCAFLLIRMIDTGDTRPWLSFGALAGVGLLNKYTMLLFGFALVAGLSLTRERRLLWTRHLLFGGLLAFLIALPNLVWLVRHGFPLLELLGNIRRHGRDLELSAAQFVKLELLFLNPAAAPLWLAGLWGLFRAQGLSRFRVLGWAFVITFAVLAVSHGSHKAYYLGPAYPMLLAAGAIVFERLAARPTWRWLPPVTVTAVAGVGALVAPTVVPLLPPETFLRYTQAIGIAQPRLERRATHQMPQFFADRFGWREMAETVAAVYHALPPAERRQTAIFANDYGQGGAIDFYGPELGLPKAIGGHLTYWYWGPRDATGATVITLGDRTESAARWFESVTEVADVGHPYAMRQEHFRVLLCRRPKAGTLAAIWPQLKQWD
jgi:hypothetical protein